MPSMRRNRTLQGTAYYPERILGSSFRFCARAVIQRPLREPLVSFPKGKELMINFVAPLGELILGKAASREDAM